MSVVSYVDEASSILPDSDSFLAVERIFAVNAALSGAQLNREKKKALQFGLFFVDSISIPIVSTVRVLGAPFLKIGVAPWTCKNFSVRRRDKYRSFLCLSSL